ncbi:hypothetical protein I305_00386 [Cryptococcus gattii E566]|uniref:Uncharacterized protein n=1 Tax=Cryptococcus gattii EJB2 TaxID=1296103 RepID=A0ABR5BV89_9TREE|nr:hypothetical protein I306_03463 [Cryptococcus gattii EJB2]KIY37290.1 hypothetical protein I305_00386 [Cryptococcus gattii E566]KJE01212.1 hypothetical protein I311_05182 [Cryptococcus gattii NT-10]
MTNLVGRRCKFVLSTEDVSRAILIDPIFRRNILTLKKSGLPLVAGGPAPVTGRETQPSVLWVSPSLLSVSGGSQRTERKGTSLPQDLSLHKCGLGKHESLVLGRNRGWDALVFAILYPVTWGSLKEQFGRKSRIGASLKYIKGSKKGKYVQP